MEVVAAGVVDGADVAARTVDAAGAGHGRQDERAVEPVHQLRQHVESSQVVVLG